MIRLRYFNTWVGASLYLAFLMLGQMLFSQQDNYRLETDIVIRQMTSQESEKLHSEGAKRKQSTGEKVVSCFHSAPSNAWIGAGESFGETTLRASKALRGNSNNINQKLRVFKHAKKGMTASKFLSSVDKVSTGSSFFGAIMGGDVAGVFQALVNGGGSGAAASGGAELGATMGAPLGPWGIAIGGVVGGLAGAAGYNEYLAPMVDRAGDELSDRASSFEAKEQNKRMEIKRHYNQDLATVYPNPKDRPDPNSVVERDPLTGMNYNLRPDVLYQRAEAIREEQRQKERFEKAVKEATRKDDTLISSGYLLPMPEVEGQPLGLAIEKVKAAGLLYTIEGGDPPPTRDLAFCIQEQFPKKSVMQSTERPVVLTVHSDYLIPDVGGWQDVAALELLEKAGFDVVFVTGDSAPELKLVKHVQSQDPVKNSSGAEHKQIRLTLYGQEAEVITVPLIEKMDIKKAHGLLTEIWLNLDAQWGDVASTAEQVGKVAFQEPAPETVVDAGSPVKAWCYFTVVPEVRGKPFEVGASAMKQAWFVPQEQKGETTEDELKWGKIQSQSLIAGDKYLNVGLTVVLEVYQRPEEVAFTQVVRSNHPLVGLWNGKMVGHSTPVEIVSVDEQGNVSGSIHYNNRGVCAISGRLVGTQLTFHETRVLSGKVTLLDKRKFVFQWNRANRSLDGKLYIWGKHCLETGVTHQAEAWRPVGDYVFKKE